MVIGTPYSLTISLTYNLANLSIELVIFIGKKKVDLVSISMITQITSLLFFPLGNPDTNSMVISSHFH